MTSVDVQELRLSFPNGLGPIEVLRGVNLSIPEGRSVGLVGESGSGKSLTGLSLLGLAGDRAVVTADVLRVNGVDVIRCRDQDLRALRGQAVGMVFQNPSTSLDPHFRIGKQLGEVLRVRGGLTRKEAKCRGEALLGEVGLDQVDRVMRAFPHELSGGMNQRVMIALAIALDPKVLVADEPTTSLDVTTAGRILDLFKKLIRDRGMSLLFISHDLGVVDYLCDQVAVMYAGVIVESGPTAEVLANPLHPYTRALLHARPSLDGEKKDLVGIPGRPPLAGAVVCGCSFVPRCSVAIEGCALTAPEFEYKGNRGVACFVSGNGGS